MSEKVKASHFVKRQTRESEFSYFNGIWEELEYLTLRSFLLGDFEEGYREGVILVNVDPEHFRTPVVKADTVEEYTVIYEPRREGEEPYKKSVAYGNKSQAKKVKIVLYHIDVLSEDSNHEAIGSEWEIVSINASPYDYDLPMLPLAMARNQMADTEMGKGGTKASYTPEQYAEAILFWSQHTMIRERE